MPCCQVTSAFTVAVAVAVAVAVHFIVTRKYAIFYGGRVHVPNPPASTAPRIFDPCTLLLLNFRLQQCAGLYQFIEDGLQKLTVRGTRGPYIYTIQWTVV
jgi:hypothetical protein